MTKNKSKYSVSDQKFWDQYYSTNNIGWDLGKETPIPAIFSRVRTIEQFNIPLVFFFFFFFY